MSLEDAEKKLYGLGKEEEETNSVVDLSVPKQTPEPIKETQPDPDQIKSKWESPKSSADLGEENPVAKNVSIFTRVTFWAFLILVIVGAGFLYYFIREFNKSKDLGFTITAPDKVMIAKPFEISLDIENKSKVVMKQPEISISLPEGMVSLDNTGNHQIIDEQMSDIFPGGLVHKKYKIVVVKGDQSIRKFDANFSYFPPNINTRFEKSKTVEIAIDQPVIDLNLATPQKIFNQETFEMGVNYKNISDLDFKNARIQLVYPSNFIFKESSATTTNANSNWLIDQISANSENSFTVKGVLNGADQSFSQIKAQLYLTFNQKEYLISEKIADLGIASSPLSLSMLIDENPNYIAGTASDLRYKVKYHNNTDVGLNDVILKVKLAGDMYDFSSLNSSGSFDSVNNVLTWNASNISNFNSLASGASGEVEFSIRTKKDYPIKRMFDKNFILKADAEITSPTVPYNVSSDKTIGLAKLETKVQGKIELSVFIEKVAGPYPPRANRATEYSVRWSIKNYSTDVKDIKISGVLQSGAKWLSIVKSNTDSIPMYNDRTGEVTWDISRIVATKGVISKPTEGTFNIEITPNITQVNSTLAVLKDIKLSAIDDFTGLTLNSQVLNQNTSAIVTQ